MENARLHSVKIQTSKKSKRFKWIGSLTSDRLERMVDSVFGIKSGTFCLLRKSDCRKVSISDFVNQFFLNKNYESTYLILHADQLLTGQSSVQTPQENHLEEETKSDQLSDAQDEPQKSMDDSHDYQGDSRAQIRQDLKNDLYVKQRSNASNLSIQMSGKVETPQDCHNMPVREKQDSIDDKQDEMKGKIRDEIKAMISQNQFALQENESPVFSRGPSPTKDDSPIHGLTIAPDDNYQTSIKMETVSFCVYALPVASTPSDQIKADPINEYILTPEHVITTQQQEEINASHKIRSQNRVLSQKYVDTPQTAKFQVYGKKNSFRELEDLEMENRQSLIFPDTYDANDWFDNVEIFGVDSLNFFTNRSSSQLSKHLDQLSRFTFKKLVYSSPKDQVILVTSQNKKHEFELSDKQWTQKVLLVLEQQRKNNSIQVEAEAQVKVKEIVESFKEPLIPKKIELQQENKSLKSKSTGQQQNPKSEDLDDVQQENLQILQEFSIDNQISKEMSIFYSDQIKKNNSWVAAEFKKLKRQCTDKQALLKHLRTNYNKLQKPDLRSNQRINNSYKIQVKSESKSMIYTIHSQKSNTPKENEQDPEFISNLKALVSFEVQNEIQEEIMGLKKLKKAQQVNNNLQSDDEVSEIKKKLIAKMITVGMAKCLLNEYSDINQAVSKSIQDSQELTNSNKQYQPSICSQNNNSNPSSGKLRTVKSNQTGKDLNSRSNNHFGHMNADKNFSFKQEPYSPGYMTNSRHLMEVPCTNHMSINFTGSFKASQKGIHISAQDKKLVKKDTSEFQKYQDQAQLSRRDSVFSRQQIMAISKLKDDPAQMNDEMLKIVNSKVQQTVGINIDEVYPLSAYPSFQNMPKLSEEIRAISDKNSTLSPSGNDSPLKSMSRQASVRDKLSQKLVEKAAFRFQETGCVLEFSENIKRIKENPENFQLYIQDKFSAQMTPTTLRYLSKKKGLNYEVLEPNIMSQDRQQDSSTFSNSNLQENRSVNYSDSKYRDDIHLTRNQSTEETTQKDLQKIIEQPSRCSTLNKVLKRTGSINPLQLYQNSKKQSPVQPSDRSRDKSPLQLTQDNYKDNDKVNVNDNDKENDKDNDDDSVYDSVKHGCASSTKHDLLPNKKMEQLIKKQQEEEFEQEMVQSIQTSQDQEPSVSYKGKQGVDGKFIKIRELQDVQMSEQLSGRFEGKNSELGDGSQSQNSQSMKLFMHRKNPKLIYNVDSEDDDSFRNTAKSVANSIISFAYQSFGARSPTTTLQFNKDSKNKDQVQNFTQQVARKQNKLSKSNISEVNKDKIEIKFGTQNNYDINDKEQIAKLKQDKVALDSDTHNKTLILNEKDKLQRKRKSLDSKNYGYKRLNIGTFIENGTLAYQKAFHCFDLVLTQNKDLQTTLNDYYYLENKSKLMSEEFMQEINQLVNTYEIAPQISQEILQKHSDVSSLIELFASLFLLPYQLSVFLNDSYQANKLSKEKFMMLKTNKDLKDYLVYLLNYADYELKERFLKFNLNDTKDSLEWIQRKKRFFSLRHFEKMKHLIEIKSSQLQSLLDEALSNHTFLSLPIFFTKLNTFMDFHLQLGETPKHQTKTKPINHFQKISQSNFKKQVAKSQFSDRKMLEASSHESSFDNHVKDLQLENPMRGSSPNIILEERDSSQNIRKHKGSLDYQLNSNQVSAHKRDKDAHHNSDGKRTSDNMQEINSISQEDHFDAIDGPNRMHGHSKSIELQVDLNDKKGSLESLGNVKLNVQLFQDDDESQMNTKSNEKNQDKLKDKTNKINKNRQQIIGKVQTEDSKQESINTGVKKQQDHRWQSQDYQIKDINDVIQEEDEYQFPPSPQKSRNSKLNSICASRDPLTGGSARQTPQKTHKDSNFHETPQKLSSNFKKKDPQIQAIRRQKSGSVDLDKFKGEEQKQAPCLQIQAPDEFAETLTAFYSFGASKFPMKIHPNLVKRDLVDSDGSPNKIHRASINNNTHTSGNKNCPLDQQYDQQRRKYYAQNSIVSSNEFYSKLGSKLSIDNSPQSQRNKGKDLTCQFSATKSNKRRQNSDETPSPSTDVKQEFQSKINQGQSAQVIFLKNQLEEEISKNLFAESPNSDQLKKRIDDQSVYKIDDNDNIQGLEYQIEEDLDEESNQNVKCNSIPQSPFQNNTDNFQERLLNKSPLDNGLFVFRNSKSVGSKIKTLSIDSNNEEQNERKSVHNSPHFPKSLNFIEFEQLINEEKQSPKKDLYSNIQQHSQKIISIRNLDPNISKEDEGFRSTLGQGINQFEINQPKQKNEESSRHCKIDRIQEIDQDQDNPDSISPTSGRNKSQPSLQEDLDLITVSTNTYNIQQEVKDLFQQFKKSEADALRLTLMILSREEKLQEGSPSQRNKINNIKEIFSAYKAFKDKEALITKLEELGFFSKTLEEEIDDYPDENDSVTCHLSQKSKKIRNQDTNQGGSCIDDDSMTVIKSELGDLNEESFGDFEAKKMKLLALGQQLKEKIEEKSKLSSPETHIIEQDHKGQSQIQYQNHASKDLVIQLINNNSSADESSRSIENPLKNPQESPQNPQESPQNPQESPQNPQESPQNFKESPQNPLKIPQESTQDAQKIVVESEENMDNQEIIEIFKHYNKSVEKANEFMKIMKTPDASITLHKKLKDSYELYQSEIIDESELMEELERENFFVGC